MKSRSLLLGIPLFALILTGCNPSPAPTGPSDSSTPQPSLPPPDLAPSPAVPVPGPESASSPTANPTVAPAPEPTQPSPPVPPSPVLSVLGEPGTKQLLMHYMPWYETPQVRQKWGSHWTGHKGEHSPSKTGDDGLPDIWSHFHPLIGLYDSTDPDALECHLLQMKLAGVNGVVADWYGISENADFPDIHKATIALFEACRVQGMKFAACYEDRTIEMLQNWGKLDPADATSHLVGNLRWLAQNWFGAPQYFLFGQRPLLLNFGPIHMRDAEAWKSALEGLEPAPLVFGLHHLWKGAGMDGGFTWVHTEPFEGEPAADEIVRRLSETHAYRSNDPLKAIPSAYPGFRDVYEKPLLSLDRREGRTMRETLRAAMEGPWPVIQLVTWNDYGEGTVIEPTHEDGYDALEAVQEARRKELGSLFTFTAGDLRLPARLFALRKSSTASPAVLDRASALLSAGQCAEASALLDSLEKPVSAQP